MMFPLFHTACLCSFLFLIISNTEAFPSASSISRAATQSRQSDECLTMVRAVITGTQTPEQRTRRKELLNRNGPYFQFDRLNDGRVEFGSTAKLVTKLLDNDGDESSGDGISEWLMDGRGLALSIWNNDLLTEIGDSVYRLQTMNLQFVTIQLAPSVDMRMWTQTRKSDGSPLFMLQSVGFDPNIQIFPGVGVSAKSLGITIEVSGQLRPSKDGKGVTGLISYATTGNLPPPMRLLPEPVLKLASDTINDTIVEFAIQSFQKGAIQNFKEFRGPKKQ